MGTLAYYAAVVTVAILLFTKAVGAGEILHEIKGLRVDLNEIKHTINEDRTDIKRVVSDILAEHRKLERRVEILETVDPHLLNNYKRAQ
jgi:hypothetical protein